MTDLDLAAIRQRYLAAAPGPWALGDAIHDGETCHHWTINSPADGYPVAGAVWLLDRLSRDVHLATADFIAHARLDVPRLVEALEAARAELVRLHGTPPSGNGHPGAASRPAAS